MTLLKPTIGICAIPAHGFAGGVFEIGKEHLKLATHGITSEEKLHQIIPENQGCLSYQHCSNPGGLILWQGNEAGGMYSPIFSGDLPREKVKMRKTRPPDKKIPLRWEYAYRKPG
jgi:hypothetical protein